MRMTRHITILLLVLYFSASQSAHAQVDTSSTFYNILSLPAKLFSAIDKKSKAIETSLDKQAEKYNNWLAKQEVKLKKKLWRQDSILAKELFATMDDQYQSLTHSIEQFKDQSASQRSGLIWVSKKFKGDMQLLCDFLSYEQVPPYPNCGVPSGV